MKKSTTHMPITFTAIMVILPAMYVLVFYWYCFVFLVDIGGMPIIYNTPTLWCLLCPMLVLLSPKLYKEVCWNVADLFIYMNPEEQVTRHQQAVTDMSVKILNEKTEEIRELYLASTIDLDEARERMRGLYPVGNPEVSQLVEDLLQSWRSWRSHQAVLEVVCPHRSQDRVRTHRGYHCGNCGKRF